jgi:hypothetical protein
MLSDDFPIPVFQFLLQTQLAKSLLESLQTRMCEHARSIEERIPESRTSYRETRNAVLAPF